jgi:hypothetical protein
MTFPVFQISRDNPHYCELKAYAQYYAIQDEICPSGYNFIGPWWVVDEIIRRDLAFQRRDHLENELNRNEARNRREGEMRLRNPRRKRRRRRRKPRRGLLCSVM